MARSPVHCMSLTVLVLPLVLAVAYLLAAFPSPPAPITVHQSLASLPQTSRSWTIYPEDFYPGGAYAELPYGKVRYWLMGPEKGRKIVLIHGLSIPAIIWKDVAPALASNKYRVLVYGASFLRYLYGRGYSDAPQTTYDPTLYTTQLALLMQHIRWEKAIVCGVSMGGGIAAAFTSQFPQLVDENVVLIASAGIMDSGDISRTAKFMSSPLVQTLASSGPVRHYLQRLANSSSSSVTAAMEGAESSNNDSDSPDATTNTPHSASVQAALEIVRLQSAHLPGYNAALSSSLRDGPIRGQHHAFTSEGFEDRRVLLIHGTKDATVHPRYAEGIMDLLPEKTRRKSKVVYVDGAGHDLTLTEPERVGGAMWEWFEGRG
ncbi:hypothetical protein D9611_002839 [Ephemerocybe angulata]|uniref:AB hydrolase-1 domain-containing protein n=1 Tax=Ephemerocybe angulata TaxID=980116 RepID=A0A8H5FDY0_9AGAR|nr:hypothetical protein D9611_002839 [Tulosesus angulatus]